MEKQDNSMAKAPFYLWLAEVDSTNRYARDNLAELPDAAMVVAAAQTAGRGRRGRVWESPPNCNLYTTFVLKNWSLPPYSATWLASLATLAATRQVCPTVDSWIKWPNDIHVGVRKLAGILCETVATAAGPPAILLGIGVNVNMPPAALAAIDKPATSLLAEAEFEVDLKYFTMALGNAMVGMYISSPQFEFLLEEWRRANRVVGGMVCLRSDNGLETRGRALGIADDGALLVDDGGVTRSFHSGDVSLAAADDVFFQRMTNGE